MQHTVSTNIVKKKKKLIYKYSKMHSLPVIDLFTDITKCIVYQ